MPESIKSRHKFLQRFAGVIFLSLTVVAAIVEGEEMPIDVTSSVLGALEKSDGQLVRTVLDNGTICLVKEDHSAPVVAVQIWIGTGSMDEQEYLGAGLSHGIEHMIFKGTLKRAVGQITKEINEAGGKINAYTSLDRTVFHADLPSRNWRVGLDVLSDAVMHATLPEKEWDKERLVILREFAMGEDNPDRVLDKLLWATCFSVHPCRFPVIGYDNMFKKLTRDDMALFKRRNYVPDNMIIVIVGDINAGDVDAAIRDDFASFDRIAHEPVVLPEEPRQIAPRFARKTGPYKVSRLAWAYHTVPMSHPDLAALDLLSQIVGNGNSSRLVLEIKEKESLVHGIGAASETLRDVGIFEINAEFEPGKETDVISAIQKEVDSWSSSRFSEEELERARRKILVGALSTLETASGQAGSYATGEFYAQDPRRQETYLCQIRKVTPELLEEVARKYLRSENRTLAILSPETAEATNMVKQFALTNCPPRKIALSCGVPLIVREDHRLPFVYFCVSFGGGSLSETDSNCGITRLMSSLMVKGTKTRSREDIARAVECLGGMLEPYSGYDGFGLQARCLSSDAETFMDILSDCLFNASFQEEEIEKQKIVQLAQLDQEQEQPSVLAKTTLRELLFHGHPYSYDLMGTKETLSKITRSDLQAQLKKEIVSGNMVVAIFGDITESNTVALAGKYLIKIPNGAVPSNALAKPNPALPARMEHKEPVAQTVLMAGFPSVSIKDPRSDALTLLQTAMSGLSSDLAVSIRDKRGLAYYVGASQITGGEAGAFVIYAGTREDAVKEVESLFRREMARIVEKGLRADELERARGQITADFDMSLQDNLGTAMRCALDELSGLGYEHAFDTKKRFEMLTAEDVQRAAASIFSEQKMAVSIILPEHREKGGSVNRD